MRKNKSARIASRPVAEGVRFEIGDVTAYAVRNKSQDISIRVRQNFHFFRNFLKKIPLVRGVVRLIGCISQFFSALSESAELRPQAYVQCSRFTKRFAALFRTRPQTLAAIGSAFLTLILMGTLMIGLPTLTQSWLLTLDGLSRLAVNIICCFSRIAGTLFSIFAIARLPVLNRLCMYRGAAGKVINAYETYGAEMTRENVLRSSRFTHRSDGAFVIVVLIFSLIAFAAIRPNNWAMQIGLRLATILTVAAVVNELILPLERSKNKGLGAILRRPLIGLQYLFTLEPRNKMVEVAMNAFYAAYENDFE